MQKRRKKITKLQNALLVIHVVYFQCQLSKFVTHFLLLSFLFVRDEIYSSRYKEIEIQDKAAG